MLPSFCWPNLKIGNQGANYYFAHFKNIKPLRLSSDRKEGAAIEAANPFLTNTAQPLSTFPHYFKE